MAVCGNEVALFALGTAVALTVLMAFALVREKGDNGKRRKRWVIRGDILFGLCSKVAKTVLESVEESSAGGWANEAWLSQ